MIKNLSSDDEPQQPAGPEPAKPSGGGLFNLYELENEQRPEKEAEEPFILSEAKPATPGEMIRQTGLAWSVGVAFTASVIFMMVVGWGADLLFGSSPWGIVAGIVLGALIGFVQLFRISSQIFRK